VVLVRRLGGDRRVKKIVLKPKWSGSGLSMIVLESENGNKRDTASEENKAKEIKFDRLRKKRCIQGESTVALHLAHFLKLFRPPLCHLHRNLHVVTTDIYFAYFRIFFCARHTLHMLIPSKQPYKLDTSH